MPESPSIHPEVVIFGGGVAGLWLLDELRRAGRSAVLLERNGLGAGQTIGTQGIIHGGVKYTLGGRLTPSARALAVMPDVWRACLAGRRKPDLTTTRMRGDYCHLWRTTSLRSKVAMIGARAGLRTKPLVLAHDDRPAVLADCPGTVARIDEPVIDPVSMLEALAAPNRSCILSIAPPIELELDCAAPGQVRSIALRRPSGDGVIIQPKTIVLTAGRGNAALREQTGLSAAVMQVRPLHMIMARGELPVLNGHCVDGNRTRITVTSDVDESGRTVWIIGGQISEDGVKMSEADLIDRARHELPACIPALSLDDVEWATWRVDRAEPATAGRRRPDGAFARPEGNVITAWPTKLVLAPDLAERIMRLLGPVESEAPDEGAANLDALGRIPADWPRPTVAAPPWETASSWT